MPRVRPTALPLLVLLLLTACGQKGPLILPDDAPLAVPAANSDAAPEAEDPERRQQP
jgi:predicted small lipoprotein YifL